MHRKAELKILKIYSLHNTKIEFAACKEFNDSLPLSIVLYSDKIRDIDKTEI